MCPISLNVVTVGLGLYVDVFMATFNFWIGQPIGYINLFVYIDYTNIGLAYIVQ